MVAVHSFRRVVTIACALTMAAMYLFVFADYMRSGAITPKMEVSARPGHASSGPGIVIIREEAPGTTDAVH